MSRADLRTVVDARRLEEGGVVEVFLLAVVFLTGLLLTGAETP
jgi:hypothetical protein